MVLGALTATAPVVAAPTASSVMRAGDVLVPQLVVDAPPTDARALTRTPASVLSAAERFRVSFDVADDPHPSDPISPMPDTLRDDVVAALADVGEALGDGPGVDVVVTLDADEPHAASAGPTYLVSDGDRCVASSQWVGTGNAPQAAMPEIQVRVNDDVDMWQARDVDPSSGRRVSLLHAVLMHEVVHGLGMASWTRADVATGTLAFTTCRNGVAMDYDRLLVDGTGTDLLSIDPIAALVAATTDAHVRPGGSWWPVFTPSTWQPGSSLAHFAADLVQAGVMTPSVGRDPSEATLGAATLEVLTALGWSPAAAPTAPQDVQVAWNGDGTVAVAWEPATGASRGYTVRARDQYGRTFYALTAGTSASLTVPASVASLDVAVIAEAPQARAWAPTVHTARPAPATEPAPDPDPDPGSDPDLDPVPVPTRPAGLSRLAGPSRYATAAAVSAAAYDHADTVLLATGRDFPDALAGAAVAGRFDAPVLLTDPIVLPPETAVELARLQPRRVVVLGGAGAVSETVVTTASRAAGGADVERLAGADRYATAAAIAGLVPASSTVLLATGRDFPDALAGAAVAGRFDAPVLLTDPAVLPEPTARLLATRRPTHIFVLGGTGAVSQAVVTAASRAAGGARVDRLAGPDRYATAAAVASLAGPWSSAWVATGRDFPDALAGAAVAVQFDAPVLLTDPVLLPEPTRQALASHAVRSITLLGGDGAVTDPVSRQLEAVMASGL